MTDAEPLVAVLNAIILIGGTTAHEDLMDAATFQTHFLDGPDCLFCLMAEAQDGQALGFQSLQTNAELPEDWGDIGTFTRREPRVPGVGAQLFVQTLKTARNRGLAAINATIRADNYSGLPYYEKMGFETYAIKPSVPLKDGRRVDRIAKVYHLK